MDIVIIIIILTRHGWGRVRKFDVADLVMLIFTVRQGLPADHGPMDPCEEGGGGRPWPWPWPAQAGLAC